MNDRLLIIGSGALACLFAARIGRVGIPVFIYDTWAPGLEALRNTGVELIEGSQKSSHQVTVLDNSQSFDSFSMTLLLTKTYQTFEALEAGDKFLANHGTVLSLQNGLTARGKIAYILGEDRVLSGITTCAAQMIKPGIVRFNGGNTVHIGSHPVASDYQNIFAEAGFDVTIEPKISEMIWEKALLNSAINPLGALLGLTNGQLRKNPQVVPLIKALLIEGCRTARSEGIDIDENYLEKRLIAVLEETADNHSSMLQDILNGRQTEIDDINGELVEIAGRNAIPTPVQETITQLVKALQRKAY